MIELAIKRRSRLSWILKEDNVADLRVGIIGGGIIGASIAYLLIFRWFGLASFSIPFLILILGLSRLGIKPFPIRKTFTITLLTTIVFSIWLGVLSLSTPLLGSGLGGQHGYHMGLYLKNLIGLIGTLLLLI